VKRKRNSSGLSVILQNMYENNKYTEEYLKGAHEFSIFNDKWINGSDVCGCFYCQTIFERDKIVEWIDKGHFKGMTAVCPNCGIDSVIGANSNLPVRDMVFLAEMHSYWF
jgi:hypothetical protein